MKIAVICKSFVENKKILDKILKIWYYLFMFGLSMI